MARGAVRGTLASRYRSVLLCALVAGVAAGCTGADPPAVGSTTPDCFHAWNDTANAQNRADVVGSDEQWRVTVSRWIIDHPAEDLTGEGCAYFFFTDARWVSFSGAWKHDGGLRWGVPPTQRGPRLPDQQVSQPNGSLAEDGTLGS